MQALDYTPIFIILAGIAVIALLALTMRSIIRRDRAMIRDNMDEEHKIANYKDRWRDTPGA
jgi:hypothetical protein